jgi:hypothetical protein
MIFFSPRWRIFLLVFAVFFIFSCRVSSNNKGTDKSVDSAATNADVQTVDDSNQDTGAVDDSNQDTGTVNDSNQDTGTVDDSNQDTGTVNDSNQDTGTDEVSSGGDIPEPLECTRYVSVYGNNSNSGLTDEFAWRTVQQAADLAPEGSVICVMEGLYQERVVIKTPNLTFQGHPRRTPTSDGGFELRADDIRIQGFKITSSVISDRRDHYSMFIRADRAAVLDNYFYDILGGAAIRGKWDDYPYDAWIAFNKIYNCAAGINVQGENWLVEYNEVERLHHYDTCDADYARFFGDNHIFRHNTFHGTTYNEIGWSHVDCFQTFDSGGSYSHTHNILIENNVCYGFHQGIMSEAKYHDYTDTITVRNNVFANFESAFIRSSHGIIVKDIPNYTIEHNTFINIGVRGVLVKKAEHGSAKHEVVKNNIFYNTGGIAYSFWDGSQTSQGGYNIVYRSDDPSPKWPADLIGVDPQFVNADQRNFHVVPGSPACDGGENGSYIGAYPCQ